MKERLQLLLLGVLLLLAQQLVGWVFPAWARPDLVLCLALALGLRARATEALVFAFALGYAVDVFSAAPFGLHALLRGTACVATRLFDSRLYLRAPLPWALFVAGYALADGVAVGLALDLAPDGVPRPWLDVIWQAPGSALLSALAAAPLFRIQSRIDSEAARDERMGVLVGPGSRV
jgi:rod shape-determining protein MreD